MKKKEKDVFEADYIQTLLDKSKTLDWLEETLYWANKPVFGLADENTMSLN